MPDPARRHALHEFCASRPDDASAQPGVIIRPVPFRVFVNLRGDPGDGSFLSAAENATGQALPTEANRCQRDALTICWAGPDEWLLIGDPVDAALPGRLAAAVAGHHAAATDVSGGFMMIELSGARATDVLAQGCTLDLGADRFAPGRCAQTRLARAGVLLIAWSDAPVYRLVVRRSFADYVARWLGDAAAEYGVRWACD